MPETIDVSKLPGADEALRVHETVQRYAARFGPIKLGVVVRTPKPELIRRIEESLASGRPQPGWAAPARKPGVLMGDLAPIGRGPLPDRTD